MNASHSHVMAGISHGFGSLDSYVGLEFGRGILVLMNEFQKETQDCERNEKQRYLIVTEVEVKERKKERYRIVTETELHSHFCFTTCGGFYFRGCILRVPSGMHLPAALIHQCVPLCDSFMCCLVTCLA